MPRLRGVFNGRLWIRTLLIQRYEVSPLWQLISVFVGWVEILQNKENINEILIKYLQSSFPSEKSAKEFQICPILVISFRLVHPKQYSFFYGSIFSFSFFYYLRKLKFSVFVIFPHVEGTFTCHQTTNHNLLRLGL